MTAFDCASRSRPQAVTGMVSSNAALLHSRVSLRAMTVSDGALLKSFFQGLSPLARRRRFMSSMRDVPDQLLRYLAGVDQQTHVGYLAETIIDGYPVMIAEARYVIEQTGDRHGDFALAVADAWQGHGIGRALLGYLEQHAIAFGCQELGADTLADNTAMIGLAKRQGFAVEFSRHDARAKKLTKRLIVH